MTETETDTLVFATRPQSQNKEWAQQLQQTGLAVAEVPMLAIEPVTDAESMQAVKNIILDFDQFNKVIFVSQNAVSETHKWLDQYWPQLPVGLEYFSVGEKTALAAQQQLGITSASSGVAMNSEALLTLPELEDVWGQRILICRGRGGLPKLGEVLHQRGAFVHYCELYHRSLPPQADQQFQTEVHSNPETAFLVPVFSGETLANFEHVVNSLSIDIKARITLVVPGKRVQQQAENLGYQNILCAENAGAKAMYEKVIEYLSGL